MVREELQNIYKTMESAIESNYILWTVVEPKPPARAEKTNEPKTKQKQKICFKPRHSKTHFHSKYQIYLHCGDAGVSGSVTKLRLVCGHSMNNEPKGRERDRAKKGFSQLYRCQHGNFSSLFLTHNLKAFAIGFLWHFILICQFCNIFKCYAICFATFHLM